MTDTATDAIQTDAIAPTFASLGVAADLVEGLAEAGITHPFPIQALTIPDALAGRDVCGKAKTGSGKTLAFGLPLIERNATAAPRRPRGLVMVPTRELALQVHKELVQLGAKRDCHVVAIYGGANMDAQIAAIGRRADIVIATPGRLIDLIQREEISMADVSMVVLDEADRMADMGFLPQVEWVLRHVEGQHQTLLFSATLDNGVSNVVRLYQHDPVFHEVVSSTVTVEEMTHRFIQVHELDKVKVVAAIARPVARTLVFVRTKFGADRLVTNLEREGVGAVAIHSGLRQTSREKAIKDFSAGKLQVLVATDVAARGIHIDDIGIVVHFDPPEDHKAYLHRSGRTARAGDEGLVVTLSLWNEERLVRVMMKRVGIDQPIVEMLSNDPRLGALSEWDPLRA